MRRWNGERWGGTPETECGALGCPLHMWTNVVLVDAFHSVQVRLSFLRNSILGGGWACATAADGRRGVCDEQRRQSQTDRYQSHERLPSDEAPAGPTQQGEAVPLVPAAALTHTLLDDTPRRLAELDGVPRPGHRLQGY